MDQVKQFILESGSVPDQQTIYLSSSLYKLPHIVSSILSPTPSNFSDHLTTAIVDIAPSRVWLVIVALSGVKDSICADSVSPHQIRNRN